MEDEGGILLLGIAVLILLVFFIGIVVLKKRHRNVKERKAASMKSSEAK